LRHTVDTSVELLAVGRVLVHAVGVGAGQLEERSLTARDILLPVAAVALGGKIGSGVGTRLTVRNAGHTGVELATVDRVPVGATRVGADYFMGFVNGRGGKFNEFVDGRFLVMGIVSFLVVLFLLIKFFMMAVRFFMVMFMKRVLRCFLVEMMFTMMGSFLMVMFFMMVENASVIVMIFMIVMISMIVMRFSMMISMVVMRFSMMISMVVMRFSMMTSMMVVRSSMMTTVIPYLLMTDDLTDFWVRLIISPFLQSQPDSPGPLVRQQYGLGHS